MNASSNPDAPHRLARTLVILLLTAALMWAAARFSVQPALSSPQIGAPASGSSEDSRFWGVYWSEVGKAAGTL